MKKLLKKSLLIGMGALSLTREKAEKIVRELEEKGDVTSGEAKDFVNDLMERGEQERQVVKDAVIGEIDKVKKATGFVTKQEFAALEERLNRLESQVSQHQSQHEENIPPTIDVMLGE